jgi:hypothetical protein
MGRDEQETTSIVVKLSKTPKSTDMTCGAAVPSWQIRYVRLDKYLIPAAVKTGNKEIHDYIKLDPAVLRTSVGDGTTFFKLSSSKE